MRFIYLALIIALTATHSYADISTTINNIDNNFANPQKLIPLDLDKDGDIDVLAVANNADNTVDIAWWENDGTDLVFTERNIATTFNEANSLFAIDLDKDGDIDVLSTAGGGTDDIAWWENDGTPSSGTWNQYTIDNNFAEANFVIAIDMDKDGDLDILATANNADNTVDIAWWENDGNPKKDNWANQYNIEDSFNGANSLLALDLDVDGDIDVLATANTDDDISWWENDGNPKKNDWTKEHVIDSSFDGANSVFAADMDTDGDLDVLAAADTGDDVSWWVNDGTPNNNDWTEYTIDSTFDGASSIYVNDMDLDGDLDVIAAANVGNDISWWTNNGSVKRNAWTESIIKTDFTAASFVTVFDFDRDGDPDIMATSPTDNDVSWWKNNANLESGNIGFTAEHKVDDFFDNASSVNAIDLDADGNIDIIGTGRLADDLTWWKNDASPADSSWQESTIDGSLDGAYASFVLDLDRDGDIDIQVAAYNGDSIIWYENDGSETFTKNSINTSFNGANSIYSIDIDQDGDFDIVATAYFADELAWWDNNGSESFTKKSIDSSINGASSAYCLDFDYDGDIDILATAMVNDDVLWYENDGSETFTKRKIDENLDGALSISAADIDMDGDLDIVSCGKNGNDIAWYANDGTPEDGGWIRYFLARDFNGASRVNLADLDLDGDIDIITAAEADDDIVWWENDRTPASGSWTKHTIDSDFNGPVSLFITDLDHDAYPDVLAAAEDGNAISWWENGGETLVSTESPTGPGATANINVDFTTITAPSSTPASTLTQTMPVSADATTTTEAAEQEIDVRCFIATAAFDSEEQYHIERLCRFRDKYLLTNHFGRLFVKTYYRLSPPLARFISDKAPLKRMVRGILKLLLCIIPAEPAFASEEVTVGSISLDPPEDYVLVEETKTKKKRIYKKQAFENLKQKLKFIDLVTLEAIEYRYNPVHGKPNFIEDDFELLEIKDKKAILIKDYTVFQEEPIIEDEPFLEEITLPEIEEPIDKEAPTKKKYAQKLVSKHFYKIETKKISDVEYEVTLPTIFDAVANFGEALGAVVSKINAVIDPEKSTKIYFKTSIGKAELGASGLLIDSLSANLKSKSGIKDKDLILSINNLAIRTIQDAATIFSRFTGNSQTFTIKLKRDDEDLTLTYYIK